MKHFILIILCVISSLSFAKPEAPNKGNTQSGNDCFFNATLEALFHIKPFRDFLENAKKEKWYEPNSTPGLVIDYINTMAKNTTLNDSTTLRKSITNDINAPKNIKAMSTGQHDAQELFSYILNTFNEQTRFHTKAKQEFDKAFIELINKDKKIAFIRDEIWLATLNKGIDINKKELKKNILKTLAEKQEQYLLKNLYYIILEKSKEEKNFFKKIDEILEFYKNFKIILNQKDIPIWCQNIKELENKNIMANDIINLIDTMIMIQEETKKSVDPYNKAKQPKVLEQLKQIAKKNTETIIHIFKNDENLFSQFRSLKKEPAIKDVFDWTSLRETLEKYNWEKLIQNISKITNVQSSLRNIFGLETEKTIDYGFGYGDPISELYWLLPLALEKNYSLIDLLNDFFKEKKQNDEFPKEKCSIKKLPEVITIQFKRFGKDLNNKDTRPITFPLTNLDMKPYCLKKTNEKKLYDLTAIIEHVGGTNGGHYWAQGKWKEKWYDYNDSSVNFFNNKEMQKIANQKQEIGNPYLLIYVRNFSPESKEEDTSDEISGKKSRSNKDKSYKEDEGKKFTLPQTKKITPEYLREILKKIPLVSSKDLKFQLNEIQNEQQRLEKILETALSRLSKLEKETPKSEEQKEIRSSLEVVQKLLMTLKQKLVKLTEEIIKLQGN